MKNKAFHTVLFLLFALLSCSAPERGSPVPQPDPDPTPEVPEPKLSDQQLMDQVQKDVIKYFWDYAEEQSGLARERYHIENPGLDRSVISVGGSGFGFLNLLVGVERGFLNREEVVSRLEKQLDFLQSADRFHGAWPHWLNGSDGKVLPFSSLDDGGDLVETAFLAQGLLCVREYFAHSLEQREKDLAKKADQLWKGIEWNWYTQGQEVLYWHWSPNHSFSMNMKVQGFDETLITYVLAASSPTFPITKSVYTSGWARGGAIRSGASLYGVPLEVAHNGQGNSVGPLFWSHYSFLALDPRGLSDEFVNYGNAVMNHAKIMYQYALQNPKNFSGYGAKGWGLTASYSRATNGSTTYSAHSLSNDMGVISPTASLSSMPYLPQESLVMLRYLYEEEKEKLVGPMGPYDAYSLHYNWVTPRYLAIDQGTIAPMVENHRTSFLWKLFMNAPEIKEGLKKLGFSSSQYGL